MFAPYAGQYTIGDSMQCTVAAVPTVEGSNSAALDVANARLIAAAPELLAIAEQVLNLTLDESDVAHVAMLAKARAAIARATTP
jgi:hypothetical protein